MIIDAELARRHAERDAFLARAVAMLRADPRVVAVWLTGSLGRGDGDGLSDVDLWVIVRDDAIAEIIAARHVCVGQIGVPILVYEEPRNAPPGGAFLLVLYDGTMGPHEMDWTWQPLSTARMPPDARLLFSRAAIPPVAPQRSFMGDERATRLTNRAFFAWAMCPVAAKKIARRQSRAASRLIEMIERATDEIRWLCSLRDTLPPFEDRRTNLPPAQPAEQLAALRTLTRTMESLSATIAAHGGTVPFAVIPHVYDFYDFTERLLAEHWQSDHPPGSGSALSQS